MQSGNWHKRGCDLRIRPAARRSTGIEGGHGQKLLGHAASEVAEPETRFAEVTPHLPIVEDQGEGKGQDPNHGEDHESLLIALVEGGLLQMPVGGEGLK
jgi:hypothetical protein